MNTKRCPYCHEHVPVSEFSSHCDAHEKLRADGQQEEYVTLPPESRSNQSLEDEPQVYVHKVCGGATGMPEEIVRSYLVNPYLYLADRTFCTGCGKHVPLRECMWVDTGEDLQTHIDRLRSQKPECRPGLLMRLLILCINGRWLK